jgi:hypothetical protein
LARARCGCQADAERSPSPPDRLAVCPAADLAKLTTAALFQTQGLT